MNQDPHKNDDIFPQWDFSDPDWLREEPVLFTKEESAPAAEEPVPSRPAPAPEPAPEPTPEPQPAPRRTEARPRPETAPARHSQHSRNSRTSHDWEQHRGQSRTQRSGGGRSIAVIVLILLLIGGMIYAGWQLGSILLGYKRDRSAYEQLATSALITVAEPEDTPVPNTPDPEATPGAEATPEPVQSEIPFTVDWDYLSSVNSDIIGWLYCPDTIINYPVVQCDNHDYYLSHSFEGNYSSSGALFADRSSVVGINQSHLIIYGHNMKDDSMFGILGDYVDDDFYEEHPIFYFLTPEGSYRVELISAGVVESVLSNFPVYFSSTSEYESYLDKITSNAYWVNSDAVSSNYQLLTMSTCTYGGGYNDPRFLVHGMMIPIE